MKRSILLLLFTFVTLQACNSTQNPERPRVAEPNGSGGSKSVSNDSTNGADNSEKNNPASISKSAVEPVYTELAEDKCVDKDSNSEEEWSVQSCEGIDGYKLLVSEGDLRQTIDVVFPDGKKHELKFWSVVSSGFSTVGDKAEWRVIKKSGKRTPIALIVRYNVNEDAEDTEKITSYLTVSKITATGACVTAVVKPIKEANKRARELADNSSAKPCLR